jgi:hypothetical protein
MDLKRPRFARQSDWDSGADADVDLGGLAAAEHELSSQISEIEQFINEVPRQVRRQEEERRTVMPPPDDLDDRKREKIFYQALSRREIRNERRSQARNLLLLLLLIAATLSISLWVYSVIQGA